MKNHNYLQEVYRQFVVNQTSIFLAKFGSKEIEFDTPEICKRRIISVSSKQAIDLEIKVSKQTDAEDLALLCCIVPEISHALSEKDLEETVFAVNNQLIGILTNTDCDFPFPCEVDIVKKIFQIKVQDKRYPVSPYSLMDGIIKSTINDNIMIADSVFVTIIDKANIILSGKKIKASSFMRYLRFIGEFERNQSNIALTLKKAKDETPKKKVNDGNDKTRHV